MRDWDRLAQLLCELWGSTEVIENYMQCKASMDPYTLDILLRTVNKIKVTHFGSVQVILSWPKGKKTNTKTKAHLGWSNVNTRMVHALVMMVLRVVELSS